MREFHGTATEHIAANPDDVFAMVTDIERLPDWNRAIESVAGRPKSLSVGDQWCVVMHPPRLPRWRSRSQVLALDTERRQFNYRTQTDDGNPSFMDWNWSVVPDGDGARVVVSWDADVKTLGRQLFAAPFIRGPGLRREVPASLEHLRLTLERTSSTLEMPAQPNGGVN